MSDTRIVLELAIAPSTFAAVVWVGIALFGWMVVHYSHRRSR